MTPARVVIGCVVLLAGAARGADAPAVTSPEQACQRLKRAAAELRLATRDLTGRYYCDPLKEVPDYYVIALRYRVEPDELVGSNRVGWFAVARSDGSVLGWDVNEERATPLALARDDEVRHASTDEDALIRVD